MCTSLLLPVVVGTLRSRHVSLIFRELGAYCHIRIRTVDITCISGSRVLLRWIMASYREYSPGSEARHPCTCLELCKSRCYYGRWNRDSPNVTREVCASPNDVYRRICSPLEIEFARAKRKEHLSLLASGSAIESREISTSPGRDRESLWSRRISCHEPTYRSPLSLSLSRSSVERSTRHLFSRARRRDREKRAFRRLAEVRTGKMYTRRLIGTME